MRYVNRVGRAALVIATLVINPVSSLAQKSMEFRLDVTLSEKAAQGLAALGEGITTGATFYGMPNKRGEKHANEIGNIDLGYEQIDLPGKQGAVQVTGRTIDAKMLDYIDGPAMVNVNVYSSRKASEDNILSCDLIDGHVQTLQAQAITVHCGLIEENLPLQTRP